MADRLLLRGGAVVSMDPDVGNLPIGDILIEGDKIVQIAANIQADALVMDVHSHPVTVADGRDFYRGRFRRVLYRIGYQVNEHLLQLRLIGADWR